MYIPAHFQIGDVDTCQKFIEENPFSHITLSGSDGLESHSIPLLPSQICAQDSGNSENSRLPVTGKLLGHIARANDVWRRLPSSTECLVHFPVTDSYITPSWYAEKQLSGKVVPTWNYVHIYAWGKISFVKDTDWLKEIVTRLTNHMERSFETPWKVTDAPDRYIETMLRGIMGVEIDLREIAGKAKLNQNHPLHNRTGVSKGLEETNLKMSKMINLSE